MYSSPRHEAFAIDWSTMRIPANVHVHQSGPYRVAGCRFSVYSLDSAQGILKFFRAKLAGAFRRTCGPAPWFLANKKTGIGWSVHVVPGIIAGAGRIDFVPIGAAPGF